MKDFLLYFGAKIYQGRRIYLHSMSYGDFCGKVCLIRGVEYDKAYFDIKENRFYNLNPAYVPIFEERKREIGAEEIQRKLKEIEEQREAERKQRRKEYIKDLYSFSVDLFIKNQNRFHGVGEAEQFAIKLINKILETFKQKVKSDITFKCRNYLIEKIISILTNKLESNYSLDNIYLTCKDFEELIKDYKATNGIIKRTNAQKMSDIKYNNSIKGKEAKAKYRHSDKGKATLRKANKKYRESEKGKQATHSAYYKYMLSEKGRQARQKAIENFKERRRQSK
jgi:hypothetical protein